jgi:hypothetical protein
MDQTLNATNDATDTPSPNSQAEKHTSDAIDIPNPSPQAEQNTGDATDTPNPSPQAEQNTGDATDTPNPSPQAEQNTSDANPAPSETPPSNPSPHPSSNLVSIEESITQWTVMVYFAIDDPGQPGLNILQKLKEVGSTKEVTILAHADPEAAGRPKSYLLQKGTKLDEDIRFRYVDPPHGPAFTEFVKWGLRDHPARHYALIIWGHGDGWQALDVALHVPGRSGRNQLQPQDMLDCQSLKSTLMAVLSDTKVLKSNRNREKFTTDWKHGKGEKEMIKIDILGMDSCLMAMAEVGYQLRHSVDYLIACEEVEPVSSWPYDYILEDLVQHPDKLDPLNLAKLIVRKYIISYKERMIDVTQSVLNLKEVDRLAHGVSNLAGALSSAYDCPLLRDAIMISRAQVQRYFETDYVDLYDFCHILVEESEHAKTQRVESEMDRLSLDRLADKLKEACQELQTIILGDQRRYSSSYMTGVSQDVKCFVPVHGLYGFTVRYSSGTSIYFPCRDSSNQYDALDFASDSGWLQFLTQYAPNRSRRVPSQNQEDQRLIGRIGPERAMGRVVGSKTDGPVVAEPAIFPDDPIFKERIKSIKSKKN